MFIKGLLQQMFVKTLINTARAYDLLVVYRI